MKLQVAHNKELAHPKVRNREPALLRALNRDPALQEAHKAQARQRALNKALAHQRVHSKEVPVRVAHNREPVHQSKEATLQKAPNKELRQQEYVMKKDLSAMKMIVRNSIAA